MFLKTAILLGGPLIANAKDVLVESSVRGGGGDGENRELWRDDGVHGVSCPHNTWDKSANPCYWNPGKYFPSTISPKHFVQCGANGECYDGNHQMCMQGDGSLGANVWCPSINGCQHACRCKEYKHDSWMCPKKKHHHKKQGGWSQHGDWSAGGWSKAPQKKGAILNVPEEYNTIQEAINDAHEGDTVKIGPGEYQEKITITKDYITMTGREGLNTVVIDGFGINDGHGITLQNVVGVKLENLVVQGFRQRIAAAPAFNLYKGVYMENSNKCIILNNIFRDNGDGLYTVNSNDNEIKYNLCEHNYHDGMFIREGSSRNHVFHNTVLDNGPAGNRNPPPEGNDASDFPQDGGCGIQLTLSADFNIIKKNLAVRNARGLQIDRFSTGNLLIYNTSYRSLVAGIIIQEFMDFATPTGNFIKKNVAKYSEQFDLWEKNSDDGATIANTWKGNDFDTAKFVDTVIGD